MSNSNKNIIFVEANVMNISAKFQLHSPLWLLKRWFLNIFREFIQGTSLKLLSKYLHYKSMEILSCHSKESKWATAIKNIICVEANVMNVSAKFQLHSPLWLLRRWFFNNFTNLSVRLQWQPIKFGGLDKIHMFGRALLKEHFCKTQFSLFPF